MNSSVGTLEVDLAVTLGSETFSVHGTGSTLTVQLRNYRQVWHLWKELRRTRCRSTWGGVVRLLIDRNRLSVALLVGRRKVWTLQPGRSSMLERLFR